MLGFYNSVKRLIYTFFVVFAVALSASPAFARDGFVTIEFRTSGGGDHCSELEYLDVDPAQCTTATPLACNGRNVLYWSEEAEGYGLINAGHMVCDMVKDAANRGVTALYFVVDTWYSGSSSTASFTCSMGKYLPAGKSTCANCPVGHWCPGGTWRIQNYDQGANPCPAGTYRYGSNQSSAAAACRTCTNTIPENATYNSAVATSTCPWTCDLGYTKNSAGTACTGNTITINYNENGGNTLTNGSCTYGSTFTLPTATRTGYKITNWTLADGTTATAGSSVSCNYTKLGAYSGTSTSVKANWTPNKYTITVKPNGATSHTSDIIF